MNSTNEENYALLLRNMITPTMEALASEPDDQFKYLANGGDQSFCKFGCVDELALDFDNFIGTKDVILDLGLISQKQYDLLVRINDSLDSMSGEENADLWTKSALKSRKEWQDVREMAKAWLSKNSSPSG